MAVRIGSNVLSQSIQRNLHRANLDLSAASERLSSGQRINKASDDPAGLALMASLRMDTRVFSQAIRNLNDGISATNIAESAMDSLGFITNRIQELATQSISGTVADGQRKSIQQEVTALQAEWNRIVQSTSFNGMRLLSGDNTRFVLQGGRDIEGTSIVQIGEDYNGTTGRVSVGTSGSEGNGSSGSVSISADGKIIGFTSNSSNLVAGDTNGIQDSFIRNLTTGTTTRISTSSSGVQANASSFYTDISANGRFASFTSTATNLDPSDVNGVQDVFFKDLTTGETRLLSVSSTGALGNGGATNGSLSADGTYAVFDSYASNLISGDTNGTRDVFLKNTVTGELQLVSSSASSVIGNGESFAMSVSSDGRFVLFNSDATNLVSGDSNGQRDVFVKDMVTGSLTRVSTDSSGTQANGASNAVRNSLSEDGRYVSFWSTATNLVSGDTNASHDTFVKDLQTGVTTRVSTNEQGSEGNGNSRVSSISSDGRFVVFESDATNLVAGDTNGQFDSFIKDTFEGTLRRLSVTDAGAEGNSLSYEGIVSADGRYVAFLSFASNLVSGDGNGVADIFVRDLTSRGVQTMSGMNVFSRASAGITLDLVDRHRQELLTYRSNLGATTSRISIFANTLSQQTINYKVAESRISDADVAQDVATATSAQIRQQVAASLLAQANLAPQIGLRLLQNA